MLSGSGIRGVTATALAFLSLSALSVSAQTYHGGLRGPVRDAG